MGKKMVLRDKLLEKAVALRKELRVIEERVAELEAQIKSKIEEVESEEEIREYFEDAPDWAKGDEEDEDEEEDDDAFFR